MYSYAISFSNNDVMSEKWREAMKHSEIRKIEYSAGGSDFDVFRNNVKTLLEMQQANVLEVASIHIPFDPFEFWTLASMDEPVRAEGARQIRKFLEICRPLNCRNFTIHGSGEPNKPEDRARIIAAMRKSLMEVAGDIRSMNASLNVEILPRTCIGNTPEELLQALDGLPPEIGINFDVNHLCGTPERVPGAIPYLAPRLRAFHLSDYDGVDECHWFPGLGVLDWQAMMREIRKLEQDFILIFEVSPLNAPGWQNRPAPPELHCANCAKAMKMLENFR